MFTAKLRLWILAIFVVVVISACALPPEHQCPEPFTETICIVYPAHE
jgi:hypothetical protein